MKYVIVFLILALSSCGKVSNLSAQASNALTTPQSSELMQKVTCVMLFSTNYAVTQGTPVKITYTRSTFADGSISSAVAKTDLYNIVSNLVVIGDYSINMTVQFTPSTSGDNPVIFDPLNTNQCTTVNS